MAKALDSHTSLFYTVICGEKLTKPFTDTHKKFFKLASIQQKRITDKPSLYRKNPNLYEKSLYRKPL